MSVETLAAREERGTAAPVRVADYMADFVHALGVRTIFMLSGTGSIHLDDAFAAHPDMGYACARHEAAAVVMAEGAAKATGGIGVVVVTTGPGGINAIGGVTEAWVDAVPVLVLSGQVPTRHLARTRYFGVQGFDIVAAVRSFTKYAVTVRDPSTIRLHLERAVHEARSGRPGPVWLDVPADVQAAHVDPQALPGYEPEDAAGAADPDPAVVDEVVAALRSTSRPLVLFGQGVLQAGALADLRRLLDLTGAPAMATRQAHAAWPLSTPGYLGQAGIRGRRHGGTVMRRADLVLVLGCSLSHALVGEDMDGFDPAARVVMVDLDAAELGKPGLPVDVALRAEVRATIAALGDRLGRDRVPDFSDWREECEALADEQPTVLPAWRSDPINSYHLVERLEAHTGPRHVVVSDAGSSYYATGQALRFENGQRELTSGAYATMGVALPMAIGAAFADPDARVVVVTGDGSIELNIQELRTLSQHGRDVKVFVINNGGYASIRDSQDAVCGGRYTDDQDVLDFRKVADAFDLPFHLIEREAQLDELLPGMLAERGPALVEVVCDTEQEMVLPPFGAAALEVVR